MAGKLLRNISQHIIHMSITGDNPEKSLYTDRDVCPGYIGDWRALKHKREKQTTRTLEVNNIYI